MWSDECYFNIEGECEFFRDWLTETKDEVIKTNFCMYYFLNKVYAKHSTLLTTLYYYLKVRIYVILGEWTMHLALIEAMYQMKMIGGLEDDNKDSNVGNKVDQEKRYFVVGVEKDEWDVKGRKIIIFSLR